MKILIGKKEFDIPECWEDCSDELKVKLAALCSVMPDFEKKGSIRSYAVWIEVLRVVLGSYARTDKRMGGRQQKGFVKLSLTFDRWWKKLKLAPEQLEQLIDLVRWVQDKPELVPIESFEHKGIKYLVVGERFRYTTAVEFTEGLMDFIELAGFSTALRQAQGDSDGRIEKLNVLISNFCRPVRDDLENWKKDPDYNGDAREPYNRARAEERAVEFADLDPGVKVMFLWWYEAMLQAFFEEYRELFKKAALRQDQGDNGDDEGLRQAQADGSGGRYADGRGFVMVLKNAAKSHYMGDFDKVCRTDVNVVYSLILDDWYDAQEAG